MRILAVGNFESSRRDVLVQVDTIARHLEAEGVEVARTTFQESKVRKGLDVARTLAWPPGGPGAYDAIVAQVFNHWNLNLSVMTVTAGLAWGIPVILLYHGGDGPQFLRRWGPVVAPFFRRAFAVQVASPYLGEVLGGFGVESEVVPHVIDRRWDFGRPRDRVAPRILWLRGYHPLYNPHMALRVFRRVRRELPDATMTMIGRGLLKDEIVGTVQREGIEGIAFRDVLPFADLRREVESHDVFLHTNRVDNQPLALLEAFSTGMVAVTTDVGGLRYVFEEGEGGFRVPSDDDEASAARIVALVRDPALAARTSAAALRVADRHRWSTLRGPWMELLEKARAARRR